MEKLKMQSHDKVGDNVSKIAQLFPNCVTEILNKDGKPQLAIDFEKLQAELSNDIIAEGAERYQFTWPDKRAANRLANTPTTMTLRPCREESVDFDNTQNLYIEGDNLDVLKVLRETYLGKVKMIYIDPPYNTGNDFVYNDEYSISNEEFGIRNGFVDEDGNQTTDPMVKNTESNGRFHTDWLNMIYPRLKVARDLLSEDGVIFISIDDNELKNMRSICDEVFGECRFVNAFVWEKTFRPSNFTKTTRKNTEYVLCYTKSDIELQGTYEDSQGDFSLTKKKHNSHILTLPANYVEAKFEDGTYSKGDYGAGYVLLNDIIVQDGIITNEFKLEVQMSVWSQEYLKEEINKGVYLVIKNKGTMALYARKIYQKNELKPTTLIPSDKVGDVLEGNAEICNIIGKEIFDYPKPTSLIKHFITICKNNSDALILDFFSGSATTAHAVMKLNAEDGGDRKFIMVQLPEKTDEKSEAYNAGYENICEIGKERIRRAGKKVKEEAGENADKLDIGFRVLKLDSSNMKDVYYTPSQFTIDDLFDENIKPDRTGEDLLFQIMLELGVELSAKIETKQVNGKTVHFVDDNYLITCFDTDVNESTITEIAKLQPIYFVMRDSSANNDKVIDNFDQIFRHYSPKTTCKII